MSIRERKRIKRKLEYMGLTINPMIFIYMRYISSIILFTLCFFITRFGYAVAPLVTIIYYILVEYIILDIGVKSHTKELEHQALSFFPIFLIHLKGVRKVKKALEYTTCIIHSDLSLEFRKVVNSVEVGKSLEEALKELMERMPSDNIKTIITSMIEINRVGVNIDDEVNYQLDLISEKEKQNIISNLHIIPFKIIIINILFIIIIIMIFTFIKMFLL